MVPTIAIILTDPEKNIIWVNPGFTKITGYTLLEVMGKKPNILQGPGTERDAVLRIRNCLENQIPFKEEITNYRKDGRKYLCKLMIHPIFDSDHNLINFIAFEVDGNEVKNEAEIPLFNLKDKYQTSSLNVLDESKLFARLSFLMHKNQLFLQPDLSLKMLADQLSTNTKYLSQVVNNQSGTNFRTFVNSFRVKEAKKMIKNGSFENLTFYGIAQQCGFKNKSTFYKVFKELTGVTPKQYAEIIPEHQSSS